ncbi:MAG: efflux RND transporter periplasmic adaptor subunit [Persicimonas sp.]
MSKRAVQRPLIGVVITLIAFAGALAGCDPSSASPNSEEEDDEVEAIPIETLSVSQSEFDDSFEVPAKVEADDEITVGAEIGGRLLSVDFEEGDEVSAGETLARVDTDVDSARINQLENQLASARREYERTKKLAEDGLSTPQELDQAETALEDARLAVDEAKIGVSKGRIDSPITGVVQTRYVDGGEYSAPGEPIADIVDYDEVVVVGNVPQRHIERVERGDTVEVTIPGLSKTVEGEVTHRSVGASRASSTYGVEVTLDNPDHRILPGMSARMNLVRESFDDAVLVPREAILQGYSRTEAMVLSGDDEVGEARMRVVELGPSSGPDVVVTDGLEAGDRLIVRGHRGLVNSARVRQVAHYDSIDKMRRGGGGVDLEDDEDAEGSE